MSEIIIGGFLIVGLIFYAIYREGRKKYIHKIKRSLLILKHAEKTYKTELSRLKLNPNNADLKENVLKLGREYSGLTREMDGTYAITVYDEIALMNDIMLPVQIQFPFKVNLINQLNYQ